MTPCRSHLLSSERAAGGEYLWDAGIVCAGTYIGLEQDREPHRSGDSGEGLGMHAPRPRSLRAQSPHGVEMCRATRGHVAGEQR